MTRSDSNKSKRNHIVGFHAVESALHSDDNKIEQVFLVTRKLSKRQQQLVDVARECNVAVSYCQRGELDRISGTQHHQGVVAVLEAQKVQEIRTLEDVIAMSSAQSLVLILDQVQDPHNLGACLRTAECAGVDAVIIPKDGACQVNQTVRKVASGAAERMSIITVPNLVNAMETLQQHGYWTYGTSDQATESLYEAQFSGKMVIVMGSEGLGLRRLTADKCDFLIQIPLNGSVSSLNVSVATGVTLFEINRQLSAGS